MATVARRLGDLKDEVVFVGGSILGILIDDPAGTPVRPTDDIDVIIDVTSRPAYDTLSRRLLSLGFQPDTSEGAPLCRWLVEDVVVDVMPTAGEVLGFKNCWYPDAIVHATATGLASAPIMAPPGTHGPPLHHLP